MVVRFLSRLRERVGVRANFLKVYTALAFTQIATRSDLSSKREVKLHDELCLAAYYACRCCVAPLRAAAISFSAAAGCSAARVRWS